MDQWWVSDKEFLNNADVGLIPGSGLWVRKIPWIRKWQPTPVLLPGKSPEHSPAGHKETND